MSSAPQHTPTATSEPSLRPPAMAPDQRPWVTLPSQAPCTRPRTSRRPFIASLTALATLAVAPALLAAPSISESDTTAAPSWIDETFGLANEAGKDAEYVASMQQHLGRYADWVRENDYHVAVSEDARVILITSSEKVSKKRMKLVEKTLDAFDELMTPPDRAGSDEVFQTADWGAGDHVPDAEPIVLIEVDGGAPYAALMTGLGDEHPTLSGWARAQANQPGCAEGRFALAAWQSAPDGFELGQVWRPENELVNRLARLAIHRSYGPQPTWLSVSGAWLVEMDVLKSIYCFPYRNEFVGIGEHKGWKNEVKNEFKKRRKEPLRMEEFAEWQRNTWDLGQSAKAWAFAEFMRKAEPGVLGACAEEFRKLYKDGYRTTYPDGTWTTDPNFQLTAEEQQAVFAKHYGETLLDDASTFFQKWKAPKRKKSRR